MWLTSSDRTKTLILRRKNNIQM